MIFGKPLPKARDDNLAEAMRAVEVSVGLDHLLQREDALRRGVHTLLLHEGEGLAQALPIQRFPSRSS